MKRSALLFGGILAAVLAVGGVFAVQGEAGAQGVIEIHLDESGSSASGAGVEIDGGKIAILSAGMYRVSGTLPEGQILVKVGKRDEVTLILDGADISNASEAAIYVKNAGVITLQLAEGSVNRIRSGEPKEIAADAAGDSASGGAIHAKDDLIIDGAGKLTVLGYVNNGIHCSNRLTIRGGEIEVEAVSNGVKGKDGVTLSGGSLTVRSGGDGIESDAEDGAGYGVIDISGGRVDIVSGGGSAAASPKWRWEHWNRRNRGDEAGSVSSKGIKAATLLTIRGGEIAVDAIDDALHSNGEVSIIGGSLTIATGDDGVHGDESVTMTSGTLNITSSYEGMEANRILISGGEIRVIADDDGINANGGQIVMGRGFGERGGFGGRDMADPDVRSEDLPSLRITGGAVYINAEGDGLDSNGDLIIEGGEVVVDGPSRGGNGALDSGSESGGVCLVNGGTVLAIGSSDMAESFAGESGQYSFRHNFSESLAAGSEIAVEDADGNVLFAHEAAKAFASVVFSCPELAAGERYVLIAGGETVEIALDAVATVSGESSHWSRR